MLFSCNPDPTRQLSLQLAVERPAGGTPPKGNHSPQALLPSSHVIQRGTSPLLSSPLVPFLQPRAPNQDASPPCLLQLRA